MVSALHQCIQLEQERADRWKARAQVAEGWHWKAAALLADIKRRGEIKPEHTKQITELLGWMPD